MIWHSIVYGGFYISIHFWIMEANCCSFYDCLEFASISVTFGQGPALWDVPLIHFQCLGCQRNLHQFQSPCISSWQSLNKIGYIHHPLIHYKAMDVMHLGLVMQWMSFCSSLYEIWLSGQRLDLCLPLIWTSGQFNSSIDSNCRCPLTHTQPQPHKQKYSCTMPDINHEFELKIHNNLRYNL